MALISCVVGALAAEKIETGAQSLYVSVRLSMTVPP